MKKKTSTISYICYKGLFKSFGWLSNAVVGVLIYHEEVSSSSLTGEPVSPTVEMGTSRWSWGREMCAVRSGKMQALTPYPSASLAWQKHISKAVLQIERKCPLFQNLLFYASDLCGFFFFSFFLSSKPPWLKYLIFLPHAV